MLIKMLSNFYKRRLTRYSENSVSVKNQLTFTWQLIIYEYFRTVGESFAEYKLRVYDRRKHTVVLNNKDGTLNIIYGHVI